MHLRWTIRQLSSNQSESQIFQALKTENTSHLKLGAHACCVINDATPSYQQNFYLEEDSSLTSGEIIETALKKAK